MESSVQRVTGGSVSPDSSTSALPLRRTCFVGLELDLDEGFRCWVNVSHELGEHKVNKTCERKVEEEEKGSLWHNCRNPSEAVLRAVCSDDLPFYLTQFVELFTPTDFHQVFYFFLPKKLNLFSRSFSFPSLLRMVTTSPELGEMGGIVMARLRGRGPRGESADPVAGMELRMDWIQELISAFKQTPVC